MFRLLFNSVQIAINIHLFNSGAHCTRSFHMQRINLHPLWGPALMAHSYRLGLVTWRYQVRIPVVQDIYHRGCAYYTVLQKFKGLECTVLPMVGLRCTIKNPKIIRNNSRTYSFCRDIAMIVQKTMQSNIYFPIVSDWNNELGIKLLFVESVFFTRHVTRQFILWIVY